MLKEEKGQTKTNSTPNTPSETCSEEEEEFWWITRIRVGEVGGEGGLVLNLVAMSVQSCTAFKHLSVHSGTD